MVMRRWAVFSDIHGNIAALDAVLADIEATGFDGERICLGDLIGYGPHPGEVVERIRALGIRTILGNYDKGVADGAGSCGCYYASDEARSDGAASYEFTSRVLSDADKEWLLTLPGEVRIEEADVRMLFVHGSPRLINEYLGPDRTDEQMARVTLAARADVLCVGHVHVPYHRTVMIADEHGLHFLSSGSVGKPKDGDTRACWVELALGSAEEVAACCPDDSAAGPVGLGEVSLGMVVHRVAYDVEAVAAEIVEAGLPATLAEALRQA